MAHKRTFDRDLNAQNFVRDRSHHLVFLLFFPPLIKKKVFVIIKRQIFAIRKLKNVVKEL